MNTTHDEAGEHVAGDTQRPNRAERRAQSSNKQTRHGNTAQTSPFEVAVAPAGRDQQETATATPPSRHGDRGDADADEANVNDLLVGAAAIKNYLVGLGWPEKIDPYYLRRSGWPIGSTADGGGKLVATKRRLSRHTQKLASPAS
jgi:hypothetical protein